MSRIIDVKFGETYSSLPSIVRGENLATTLRVDCSQEKALWPDAVYYILVKRYVRDEPVYLATDEPLITDENGRISYTLTDRETSAPGILKFEFRAKQDDVLVKSWIHDMSVKAALDDPSDIKPIPDQPGWVEGVLDAASDTIAARDETQVLRDETEDFRDDAAEQADYVRSLSFDINGDGHLLESRGEEQPKDLGRVVGGPGPQGEPGKDGTGISILGSFETYEALVAAHPTGNVGDAYLVQGDLYVWDAENTIWKNVGNIQGPVGPQGKQGEQGKQGITGDTGPQGPVGPPSNIDAVASRWDFVQTGNSVTVRPATASALNVTASEDCTVTHGEDTYPFVAGVAQDITATEGWNTLTASAGSLTVWYNRETMDVWDAQVPDETGSGDVVRLDYLVGDRPLGLVTKCVAQQAGTGDPSPDNVRAITGRDAVTAYRNGKNLVTYGNKVGNATVTAAPIPNGVRITSTSTTAYAGFLLPIGDRLVGETITVQGEWLASAANVGGISIFWGTDTGSGTGGAIADIRNTGEAVTVVVPASTQPETYPHIVLRLYTNRGGTLNAGDYVDYTNVMLEIGGTASAYEAYRIDAFAAALPEKVYGLPDVPDEVDFGNGVVTRRTNLREVIGTVAWVSDQTNTDYTRFYIAGHTGLLEYGKGLCTHFPWLERIYSNTNQEVAGSLSASQRLYVVILKSRITGWDDNWSTTEKAAAIRAWLTGLPDTFAVLYQIATPTMGQITPVAIPSLAGTNTVFTDAGGAVAVAGKLSGAGVAAKWAGLQAQIDTLNARLAQGG